MVLVLVIGVSLVVVFGMLKLADIAFRDPKPENMIQKDKPQLDLKYDPLAVDEGCCAVFRGPVKIGPEGDVPPVSGEQVDEFLAKVRENMKVPGRCIVCGDPMKRETVGKAVIETCDCPKRGYQPRS